MKTWHTRFSVSCAACLFLLGTLALPIVSQDAKPDEAPTSSLKRAGVNGVGFPICIHCPEPDYSQKARADKLEGSVLLDITVTLEGKAKTIILIRGLGDGLDENAIEAVKSWKFKPAKDRSGKPVVALVQIEIAFHL
jgi:TonB family protein